jgi:hypothetical protein
LIAPAAAREGRDEVLDPARVGGISCEAMSGRAAALALVALLVAGLAAAGLWWLAQPPAEGPGRRAGPAATDAAPGPVAAAPPPAADAAPSARPEAAPSEPDLEGDLLAEAWSAVDMDEVRAALPDNLYWKNGFPTNDERILRERAEEQARWNEAYGKVLSGTGSDEEIRGFYAHRERVSTDYIAFVDYLLEHYEDRLPERDVGLLQLARRLHLARLQEIPRKTQEALERKQAQDAAREAWLRSEARFHSDAPADER